MAARASADDAADAERALPSWVRVVASDVRAALREGACEARTHRWRETDVVGALVRAVRRGAGDRGVGRVFTAANERGCAALVGEDAETVDGGGGGTRGGVGRANAETEGSDWRLAIVTLDREVNLGATDGRNTKVVMLVTVPRTSATRGALEGMTRLEALKTMKMAMFRLIRDTDFVLDCRRARTAKDLVDAYEEACSVLTGEHLRKVEEEAEMASRRGAEFTGVFAGGVASDIRRRWPLYKDDWVDGFKSPTKCLSATLYMYFACLGPAIAFGGLCYKETSGMMGAMEYLCCQALSGILWAVFAGQPEIVLRPAGPQTVFIIELYKRCKSWKIDFLVTHAWVGLWTAIFMLAIALSDSCAFVVNKCTKFTQDIFSLFVCVIFIFEGLKNLFSYFDNDEYSTAAALFSLILGVMTVQLGMWALTLRSSPYLNTTIRELTADFGLASAVIMATVTANLCDIPGLERLRLSSDFEPSMQREWWIDLSSGNKYIPLIAIFPALMLTCLYYVDMNVATLLCNAPEKNMRKGAAYHLNFAVLAILVFITSLLGLPPPTGSLPHSPQYVLALSDVEEFVVDGETRQKVMKVHEQRLSPLLVNVLVALSFVVIPVLKSIPMCVLFGLFIYTGITGLYENHFWERIKIGFMEPRLHPPTSYVRHVPLSRVHAFTCVQIACVGVLWGIRSSPIALTFPIFILALMPLRVLLFKKFGWFSPEWLELLDANTNVANSSADDDYAMLDDRRENEWLTNAKRTSVSNTASNFMEFSDFAGLHESGPAFGNAASLHAHTRSDADGMNVHRHEPTPMSKDKNISHLHNIP